MRILVIEDDRKIALLLAEALGDVGHDVTVCLTGREGLAQALSRSFSLVLLDYMLPDVDGPGVVRAMRSAGLDLPILMVSARDAASDIADGLASGADDYLTKPFRLDDLFAKVGAWEATA
jgi:DNA-binding response OmpR family regulator